MKDSPVSRQRSLSVGSRNFLCAACRRLRTRQLRVVFFSLGRKSRPLAMAAVFLCAFAARAADPVLPEKIDPVARNAPVLLDARTGFEHLAGLPTDALAGLQGRQIAVDIDLENSPGFSLEAVNGRMEARFRMAFNNIAESWSWQPQADPRQEDYYRAKFLPLKSVLVERGEYDHQDKIGETQRMKVTWRYDYFLAFDNLYDFYPRGTDDDAGFVAMLPEGTVGQLRMLAVASLVEPFISESTTFWKATYAKPTDFTLKKRYLIGLLQEVWFYDSVGGKVLVKLKRHAARQAPHALNAAQR